jgi:phosphinothricin acetyltransferase
MDNHGMAAPTLPYGVRAAIEADLEQINAIYGHYALETHHTFDLEPTTLEWRSEWFAQYSTAGPHRLLVAAAGTQVLGYASSSSLRPRPAYLTSVETTVYVAQGNIGRGIGRALYRELFTQLQPEDVHRAYAGIALPNPASERLHERFGFRQVGLFHEQGRKFGRYWDVAWFEKWL